VRTLPILLFGVACCGAPEPSRPVAPIATATLPNPAPDPCILAVGSVVGHAHVTIRLLSGDEGASYDAWLRALASASPTITYHWVAPNDEDARAWARAVGLEGSGVVLETGVDREIATPSLEGIERAARVLVHAPPGNACAGAVAPKVMSTSSPGALDVHTQPLAGDLSARATSLRIEDPNRSVTLVKDGARWKVSPLDAPADETNVQKAFEALAEAKMRDAIPPDASLDLTTHIVVMAGTETLLDVTIGRGGHRGTAVRLAGAPEARIVGVLSVWALRREARFWRDRKVLEIDPREVQRIDITNGRTAIVATRRGAQWPVTLDGRPVTPPPMRAEDMLNAYRHLTAEDFPTDGDVGKDATTVKFTMAHGPARVVRIGAKRADGTFFARADGDSTVYAIPAYPASYATDVVRWRAP